jgi:AraC-like DNA-binding protein
MRAADFVESYFAAWNHRDPIAVADHLAEEGVYWDVPEKARHTHDQLIAHLHQFFTAYRHRYELIGDILEGSDTIAFQYEVKPADRAAGRNKPLFRGAEFVTLHDDTALRIDDFYEGGDSAAARTAIRRLRSGSVGHRKYAKSGLGAEQMARYKERLEVIMQKERLFLQSDLTLPKLAEAVNCSVNHLSQVINSGFGMSFFDYLNSHRVRYAKKLLLENDADAVPILNIAFAVGFNSNSAFYAAFRKCVGETPARYRKSARADEH